MARRVRPTTPVVDTVGALDDVRFVDWWARWLRAYAVLPASVGGDAASTSSLQKAYSQAPTAQRRLDVVTEWLTSRGTLAAAERNALHILRASVDFATRNGRLTPEPWRVAALAALTTPHGGNSAPRGAWTGEDCSRARRVSNAGVGVGS